MITKHDGTGGLVSVGTVTAQLLYEIAEPAYLGPDVITHFDTVRVEQAGPDRVALAGTRGSPPPGSLKVALNMLGGYRNTMTLVITGLDIEQKAEHARQLLFTRLGGTDAFDEADVRLLRFDRPDAPTNEQATAHLRITVKSQDERAVGRAFSDAALELALGGYAGFYATTPPTGASAFGVYWPALVPGRGGHPDRASPGRYVAGHRAHSRHDQRRDSRPGATRASARGQPNPARRDLGRFRPPSRQPSRCQCCRCAIADIRG